MAIHRRSWKVIPAVADEEPEDMKEGSSPDRLLPSLFSGLTVPPTSVTPPASHPTSRHRSFPSHSNAGDRQRSRYTVGQ